MSVTFCVLTMDIKFHSDLQVRKGCYTQAVIAVTKHVDVIMKSVNIRIASAILTGILCFLRCVSRLSQEGSSVIIESVRYVIRNPINKISLYGKFQLKRLAVHEWPWRWLTEGHWKWHYLIGHVTLSIKDLQWWANLKSNRTLRSEIFYEKYLNHSAKSKILNLKSPFFLKSQIFQVKSQIISPNLSWKRMFK